MSADTCNTCYGTGLTAPMWSPRGVDRIVDSNQRPCPTCRPPEPDQ